MPPTAQRPNWPAGSASTSNSRARRSWEGEVLVFDLEDHPTAPRCYAWEVDGEVTAVLHQGSVKSARDAVRASIMAL